MKKNYLRLVMAFVCAFAMIQGASAQLPWKSHNTKKASSQTESLTGGVAGNIYIGHCKYNDVIWPYDGLSLKYDARVGVGIKIPRSMFEKYIGGSISSIRCGWDDEASTATYECFIRSESFNGPDLANATGTVKFGWNEIKLSSPLPIPDTEVLCVGFYVDIKKDVCSIPKLYPIGVSNTCFLFHGETSTSGEEIWYDARDIGTMPIMLKISDSTGQFNDLIEISNLRYDEIVPSDTINVGVFTLRNSGSNSISSLEITTTQGEQSKSMNVELERELAIGASSKIKLPIYSFNTGNTKISFTKINDNIPSTIAEKDIHFICVPPAIAEQYTHVPLIEFYASENSYHIPTYFDSYFMQGYEPFKDKMNVVCQHTDDKFMIGDPDEAILLMLDLVNKDSMKVYLPDMTINRTAYASSPAYAEGTPMHMSILYPTPSQELYYNDIISHPTFASVYADATLDENNEKVSIAVNGNIAKGIMPEGENLYLTVYLIEKEVESYDQQFWDDKEGAATNNRYVHYNVIRENLTPMWGEKLSTTSGSYSMNFETEVYSDYNPEKLGVIAFLNRGPENGNLERQIINSTEAAVKSSSTGIVGVEVSDESKTGMMYDLSGRRVVKPLKGGIYILNGKKIILK